MRRFFKNMEIRAKNMAIRFLWFWTNGKMIHVQDSAVLEEGSGYSKEKVKAFFAEWAPRK